MWLDEMRAAGLAAFRSALGDLIGDLLAEHGTSDVVVLPPRLGGSTCRVLTIRDGATTFRREVAEPAGHDVVALLAGLCGRDLHRSSPILDVVLPDGGERVHASIPPATMGAHLTVRKPYEGRPTLEELAEGGMMDAGQLDLLKRLADNPKLSIIIGGMVNSGKTTLMRALMTEPRYSAGIGIVCQDPYEFEPPMENPLPLQADPFGEAGLHLGRLVADALREPGSSLSVGEVRRGEMARVIEGWNTGYRGIVTLHAPSARDVPGRIAQMVGMSGETVDEYTRANIAQVVNVVVHVGREGLGKPRVREILRLEAWDDRVPEMTTLGVD